MRQIATLPDEEQARRLADYLLTLQIETRLERQDGGWEVWVCDEDRVPQARQELDAFTHNPADPRYDRAGHTAAQLREAEERQEQEYARKQARFEDRLARATGAGRAPVTFALLAASIVITLLAGFGKDRTSRVYQAMVIAPYTVLEIRDDSILYETRRLKPILEGQVWRLVTPIFLHFDLLHLGFDMYWLVALGIAIESRRGSWRFLLLALAIAIGSNLVEYYIDWDFSHGFHFHESPFFGGMSGVDYGLFGYVWMKTRFDSESGFYLPPGTVLWMLVWFFLCLFGVVGGIANMAHAAGLLIGMVIGYVPIAWRSLRGG